MSEQEKEKEREYENRLIETCHLKDTYPDSDYDPDALEKGTNFEFEHTFSPTIAKIIAKHHLKENPKYYECLEKMEAECK